MAAVSADFKYPIGTCLHEGERQATYETIYEGAPALLKFYRADTALEASKLVAAVAESEPRLLDCGEAEVFETQVVFVVAAKEPDPEPAVPFYRKYAWMAIGSAVAAGALCAFLIRGAEKKSAPPPVIVPAAAPIVRSAPPVPTRQNVLPERKSRAKRAAKHRRHK